MHLHCTKTAPPTECAFASCAGRLAELRGNPDYHIAVAEGAPAGTSRQSISSRSARCPAATYTVTAAGTRRHTCPLCCCPTLPRAFCLAEVSSGKLLGTAALIIERKFIHSCGKVRAATARVQAAQQQARGTRTVSALSVRPCRLCSIPLMCPPTHPGPLRFAAAPVCLLAAALTATGAGGAHRGRGGGRSCTRQEPGQTVRPFLCGGVQCLAGTVYEACLVSSLLHDRRSVKDGPTAPVAARVGGGSNTAPAAAPASRVRV